jgi:hypothetical protein
MNPSRLKPVSSQLKRRPCGASLHGLSTLLPLRERVPSQADHFLTMLWNSDLAFLLSAKGRFEKAISAYNTAIAAARADGAGAPQARPRAARARCGC